MPDLLLELRSEEIPARMQAAGAESLRRAVEKRLQAQELDWSDARAYATPRRLALIVRGLPDGVPVSREVLRGPRVSAPETAVEGFLRSAGVVRDTLEKRGEGKKAAWFATREIPARTLDDVLVKILPEAVRAVRWPKSMHWGRGNFRWVRPLRGILCIVDDGDRSRPVGLDIKGIPCGAVTRGHPQMAPEEFIVESVDGYLSALENARVILDAETRRKRIQEGAAAVAAAKGLGLSSDPELVEEIAGLVEWPVVFGGEIEEVFSALPDDLLNASMRKHQKFLSLWNPASRRIVGFVGVADIEADDSGARIRAGYGRVLRARLKDALFFWKNDQRTGLKEMWHRLSGMVFHKDLGNMQQRALRISRLARYIAQGFSADSRWAYMAGLLAKADLCSETVREFPELQGIVGGRLAAEDGNDREVVLAIENQYRTEDNPIHFGFGEIGKVASGEQTGVGKSVFGQRDDHKRPAAALIVADRIDTLWGFFAAGERPTSSRDPYALRRAALVVLRTLIENERPVSLRKLFEFAEQGYEEHGDMPSASREDASSSLLEFMLERLRVDLRDGAKYGYRHDMITAAALRGAEDSPVQLKRRAEALNLLFVKRLDPDLSKQADAMLASWRRCASILDTEGGLDDGGVLDRDLYREPAEHALASALKQAQKVDDQWLNDPFTALNELKKLYEAIDPFFEQVHVKDPSPALRKNRLRLLTDVRTVLDKVADFGAIEG